MADDTPAPMTIQQQAEALEFFLWGCRFSDGTVSPSTLMTVSRADYLVFKGIAERLLRMAPFEAEIRRIVVGK